MLITKEISTLHKCPVCSKDIAVRIEYETLKKVKEFPLTHIVLHGDPIHALIVYIDRQFNIRSVEGCNSFNIERDSTSFQQIVKKWSNPF